MRTWKLVSGILSIILFVLVAFQSCAAGVSNTLAENGEVSGSAGLIVAIMLLVAVLYQSPPETGARAVILRSLSCMGSAHCLDLCSRGVIQTYIYGLHGALSVQSWRLSRWQKITKNKSSNNNKTPLGLTTERDYMGQIDSHSHLPYYYNNNRRRMQCLTNINVRQSISHCQTAQKNN